VKTFQAKLQALQAMLHDEASLKIHQKLLCPTATASRVEED